MYVPKPEDDDVEVVEIDEGELGEVLEGEPMLSKLMFKAQSAIEEFKNLLFHSRPAEPPPKLPPQFFKTPPAKKAAPGLVPIVGQKKEPTPVAPVPEAKSAPPEKPKARIMPAAQAPRRVRVIRRVRKSVRVSFIDDATLHGQIDIPRRRFTLILTACMFTLLIGGGYGLLVWQGQRATTNFVNVKQQLQTVDASTQQQLAAWKTYQDLEPRLKALSSLLDRHLSPSNLFDALEQNTLADVSYSSFTLSPDGHVVLSTTAPTFASAAGQVAAFESSGLATSVQAMGYQAEYNAKNGELDHVTFQIGLDLNPAVLQAVAPLPPTH